MNLPTPAPSYSVNDQAAVRQAVAQADMLNRKVGEDVDTKGVRLFLYDATGARYVVSVSTSGVLTATPA
jgi:hypothetical protein